jgi:epoxyqueuosine reductase
MDFSAFAAQHSCILGVCDADILPDRTTCFISDDKEKRTNPQALLPGAKSIVVIGISHGPPVYKNLSTLATNPDYHPVVKGLLKKLGEQLHPHPFRILADSLYLDERVLAAKAGLGFFGKNGLIISPKLGSFFNIGCLLTDLYIPPTPPPAFDGCPPDCKRCHTACPVGLDKSKCVSYLTQKKEALTDKEIPLLAGQLYGCDICQAVCPFNNLAPLTQAYPPSSWLNADEDTLKQQYSHTAMWWRGVDIMKRNATYAKESRADHDTA